MKRLYKTLAILLAVWLCIPFTDAAPKHFEGAKIEMRRQVYHDQNRGGHLGTLYCGCDWEWTGRSGGRIDMASCGYQVRAQPVRAARIEWEHIVPSSNLGRARQCWQDGGRSNCQRTDPVFNVIEADMHNLTPSVGEVNADRSNYRFSALGQTPRQHGACDVKVDFSDRSVEPRNAVKGMVARVNFYMHDRYNIRMSDAQQRLFIAWNRQFPVTPWERERDRRIARVMGHHNPFVTGERQWSFGHRPTADGVMSKLPRSGQARSSSHTVRSSQNSDPIRGNRNSRVYHLPSGCPSYNAMAASNIVEFVSESDAQAAGYRRAGNCR